MNFWKNIKAYNSIFVFTSIGDQVDGSINRSKGPYVFKISDQNYHRIESLLPEINIKNAVCSAIYICIYMILKKWDKQHNELSISRRHRSQNCSWLRLNVERVKYIGKKFWTTKGRYQEHP